MCAYTHQKAAVRGAGTSMPHRRRASIPITQHERRAKMRLVERQPNLYPQTPLLTAGGIPVQRTHKQRPALCSREVWCQQTPAWVVSRPWSRNMYVCVSTTIIASHLDVVVASAHCERTCSDSPGQVKLALPFGYLCCRHTSCGRARHELGLCK